MHKLCLLIYIALFTFGVDAQFKNASLPATAASAGAVRSAVQMYTEASRYIGVRSAELARQKISFTPDLQRQAVIDQRQLADTYAKELSARPSLVGDDLYYLWQLRLISGDTAGATDALEKFVHSPGASAEKQQSARAFLLSTNIREKRFGQAEKNLNQYSTESGNVSKFVTFSSTFRTDAKLSQFSTMKSGKSLPAVKPGTAGNGKLVNLGGTAGTKQTHSQVSTRESASSEKPAKAGKSSKLVSLGQTFRMESALYGSRFPLELDLARAYREEKDYTKMAERAGMAFAATQQLVTINPAYPKAAENLRRSGMLVFEAYSLAGEIKRADAALDELRAAAATIQSPALYALAVNRKVHYMVDTGRKTRYPQYLASVRTGLAQEFRSTSNVSGKLQRNEETYPLLGTAAPNLDSIDKWIQGDAKNVKDLKGKVIVLDFWALWCTPCLGAMPSINRMAVENGQKGLEIIGVTRYYGKDSGMSMDKNGQVTAIRQLKDQKQLKYDLVVLNSIADRSLYGPTQLPTAVVIDKKGVIRDIQIGGTHHDLEETVLRLLAE
jgi:thiol-disulfide isomerase/thioredoxin